jgi:5-formyltetrahydrofolate cyclo-ligase
MGEFIVKEKKEALRKKMKATLNRMKNDEYNELGKQAADALFETEEWKNADTVGITISRGKELDTSYIIKKAWEDRKKVAIPKCLAKTKEMDFRVFTDYSQLEIVYYGLQEPKIDETTAVIPDQIDLLIVPGLIYDKRGYRIGFGGGYFDRYLVNYPNAKITIAFDIQVVERIPTEQFDLPVQKIITDKRVIETNGH